MIDFPKDPRGRELLLLVERAKYSRWIERETAALIEREFNRLLDIILSSKYRDLTQFQKQRALGLYRELDRLLRSGYGGIARLHVKELKGYAKLEADVARAHVLATAGGTITTSLGPSLPKVFVESIAQLPIQGLNIGDWFEAEAQTMSRETRRLIQQGLIEGKAPAAISRLILADARAAGPVLSRRAINEARIISRTTVNAVQNAAAMASYEKLPPHISDSYIYVSVLDSRTTVICVTLNGRVYRYDDPKRRMPPSHLQCRATTRPLVKGSPEALTLQKEPLTLRNAADWLKHQPITAQNEILGVTRAGLWRDGRMQLADAIDQDNRILTLSQLRERLGIGSRVPA